MEEFTVDQNKGYVAPASKEASPAQLDEIERQAMASVISAKVETSRAESAEKQIGGKGNAEAKLYGDITFEALMPGMKLASAAVEIVDTRHGDLTGLKSVSEKAGTVKNIEDDIADASRKPGTYRAPVQAKTYADSTPSRKTAVAGKSAGAGEDLMARANITETSLKDQGKDALKSWDVPDKKMASVSEAKKLTFGMQYANEKALESVYVARQHNQATMSAVKQRAPGMDLGSGPSINPNTLLRDAEHDDSWKTGAV